MVKYSEHDRETLIRWFPNLKNDSHFEITSNCTPEYNCIAWALGMNDVWIGLDHPNNYPWAWWPQGIPCNEKKGVSNLLISILWLQNHRQPQSRKQF